MISYAEIDGIRIAYEIIGNGARNAVITPGGRFSKESPGIRELALALAEHDYRVLIWDRPNCGESDVCFEAENESVLNADVLAGLLRHSDMAPALVFGASAGSRVSLLAAVRSPDVVERLALLWITGGWAGLAGLVGVYCGDMFIAAKIGGMEAVAATAFIAEPIRRNPANRDKILSYDVDVFCDIMQRWGKSYIPEDGSPVPCLLPQDFAKITAPTLIFRSGHSDYSHPQAVTDEVHRLISGSTLVLPPWGDREWIERVEDQNNGLFRRFALLVPQLIEFDPSGI